MTATRRQRPFRTSDLTPVFKAAKAAGYDQVSIVTETADGKKFLITAGDGGDFGHVAATPLQKWKAGFATS